ncbi:hypothetical protein GGTG_06660 [Gaeumannomyces tritici R3-111a-1]|uniref:Aquaporin-like protein n=1 Tax=Gaeumannomyces tritici (strain R3-111a-1) TaxID=644352 RepID=J3NZG1_GAET3|nr:hypothetical protein GGTG_06660 [Gaeumannomyces tritici R3-111a-1]EJT76744.1 hypothetical protein GGTG_06660 [Gaeumannomyces tritici R3-111a-1]
MDASASHNCPRDTPLFSVMSRKVSVTAFDGSFAPLGRPTERSPLPWYSNRQYFLASWLDVSIWKAAILELVGTTCQVFISGQFAATIIGYGTPQIGGYIGIFNIFLVSTFIYATAAGSGGHLNQAITLSAILSGICPLARGTLYMVAQTIGSGIAGGLLRGVWGYERSVKNFGGGCFLDPAHVTYGQAFLNEFFSSFVLLFLAYGVGLDPRQAALFGPRLGPLLVGVSLGIVTFATSGMAPGYAGAQINPARCLAYGIARGDLSDQWVWWFGPAAAAVLIAILYNLIPPHHADSQENTKTVPAPLPK